MTQSGMAGLGHLSFCLSSITANEFKIKPVLYQLCMHVQGCIPHHILNFLFSIKSPNYTIQATVLGRIMFGSEHTK